MVKHYTIFYTYGMMQKNGEAVMKKVCVYARYGSDSQSEQNFEGQVRVCKEFAKKNDYVIVKKYIDRAMTGTNDN